MPRPRILVGMVSGANPVLLTPKGTMLPCEVKRGVPYLRADENDQHIVAAELDAGSDFVVKKRADGLDHDLVIAGVLPNRDEQSGGLDPQSREGMVTPSEVHSLAGPSEWDLKYVLVIFFDTPGDCRLASSGCSAGYPHDGRR